MSPSEEAPPEDAPKREEEWDPTRRLARALPGLLIPFLVAPWFEFITEKRKVNGRIPEDYVMQGGELVIMTLLVLLVVGGVSVTWWLFFGKNHLSPPRSRSRAIAAPKRGEERSDP